MAQLSSTRCAQCGVTDDHPKVHVFDGESYHYDCLSFDLRKDLIDSAPHLAGVIDQAHAGVHGDDLREHIVTTVAAATPATTETQEA